MQHTKEKLYFLTSTIIVVVLAFFIFVSPIAQDKDYHNFADASTFLLIQNFWNVFSNVGFLIVGSYGIYKCLKDFNGIAFSLSLGVFLTFWGSSYYHYAPSNATLVWDRIPMTIIFMSFMTFIIDTYVRIKYSKILLCILLVIGISSVLYWYVTELNMQGDLRPYVLVQFLPMLLVPIIFLLFKNNSSNIIYIVPVFGFYILAKLFEHYDTWMLSIIPLSGHSLKHILASISTYYMLKWILNQNELKLLKNVN
jgi:hypothetical protein